MRVLLDTNIVIHREASRVISEEIGILFKWLDRLHASKLIHPITVQEFKRLKNDDTRQTLNIKLTSYVELKVTSPLHSEVVRICTPLDHNENDLNDSLLINELYNGKVDLLISEDKKIKTKAELLGILNKVFTISEFLKDVIERNPELADYKVLSIKKEFFGNIDVKNDFFDSLKEDYPGFEEWFNRKSEEIAYICETADKILAFLYLKIESENEAYPEIEPTFSRKKRLKVGTFKTTLNRHLLGERLLKIIFDNAIRYEVDEIYVTAFDKRIEQQWLIQLLESFGFVRYGVKRGEGDDELVYVRDMTKNFAPANPKITYPYFGKQARAFIVPIYPEYHTDLLPDSILRTESPQDFAENESFRNAISKVYISRSIFRNIVSGELIVFYRTGGYYKSVVTTIGIVENIVDGIRSAEDFVRLCRKRSVFTDEELLKYWNYNPRFRPFIVNFLYTYSFPKRINLQQLIELGVIPDVGSAPRGFEPLTPRSFELILKETQTDGRVIVD